MKPKQTILFAVLVVFFIASAIMTISEVIGSMSKAFRTLPNSEVKHADVWSETELQQLEKTGESERNQSS